MPELYDFFNRLHLKAKELGLDKAEPDDGDGEDGQVKD